MASNDDEPDAAFLKANDDSGDLWLKNARKQLPPQPARRNPSTTSVSKGRPSDGKDLEGSKPTIKAPPKPPQAKADDKEPDITFHNPRDDSGDAWLKKAQQQRQQGEPRNRRWSANIERWSVEKVTEGQKTEPKAPTEMWSAGKGAEGPKTSQSSKVPPEPLQTKVEDKEPDATSRNSGGDTGDKWLKQSRERCASVKGRWNFEKQSSNSQTLPRSAKPNLQKSSSRSKLDSETTAAPSASTKTQALNHTSPPATEKPAKESTAGITESRTGMLVKTQNHITSSQALSPTSASSTLKSSAKETIAPVVSELVKPHNTITSPQPQVNVNLNQNNVNTPRLPIQQAETVQSAPIKPQGENTGEELCRQKQTVPNLITVSDTIATGTNQHETKVADSTVTSGRVKVNSDLELPHSNVSAQPQVSKK